MREIGSKCNGLVFLLYTVLSVIFIGITLILAFDFGMVMGFVQAIFLIIQWKLKKLALTKHEIIITDILGKTVTYSNKYIKSFGLLYYPIFYITLRNGETFLSQIPLGSVMKNVFSFRLNLKSYIDGLNEEISRIEEI